MQIIDRGTPIEKGFMDIRRFSEQYSAAVMMFAGKDLRDYCKAYYFTRAGLYDYSSNMDGYYTAIVTIAHNNKIGVKVSENESIFHFDYDGGKFTLRTWSEDNGDLKATLTERVDYDVWVNRTDDTVVWVASTAVREYMSETCDCAGTYTSKDEADARAKEIREINKGE